MGQIIYDNGMNGGLGANFFQDKVTQLANGDLAHWQGTHQWVESGASNGLGTPQGLVNKGSEKAEGGVSAAQSGVDAILGGGANVRADADSIRRQAGLVNGQGSALNATAGQIKGIADGMRPIADKLGGYGDDLWGRGSALYDQANDVFGQGGALVQMDPSKGGLSAEYIKYWNSLSPDRYVSQATSDTQSSYQNAFAQQDRAMARQGVNASSGAAAALNKQKGVALATALAAAKTKARQVGLDQQAAQLDKMVSAAKTMYDMGSETANQALAAQNAAGNMQNAAAGVQKDIANAYATAGGLQRDAGNLYANAGSLYGTAGQLENAYLGTLSNSYTTLSHAFSNAASYYASAANVAKSGGGGGSPSPFIRTDIDGNMVVVAPNGNVTTVNKEG